jgi:hypothetical protein
MTKPMRAVGLGSVLALITAGGWIACDNGSSPSPGADGGDAGGSSSGGSSGGSSSGASDGGDASATPPLTCETYCSLIQSSCTGPNAQYAPGAAGLAECMNACQLFDTADAMAGNTLLCHYDHALNATPTDAGGLGLGANPHCWHAGPFGWGVCGAQCQDFCQATLGYCTPDAGYAGDAQPYADLDACTTACPTFVSASGDAANGIVDGSFTGTGPAAGNTRDCREYHLVNALLSTANQQVHCGHVGPVSPVCQ